MNKTRVSRMTKVWCGLSPPSARQNHVVNHGYITSGSSRLFSASRCVARLGFNSITNTPEREIEDLVSIIYHYLVGSVVPFPTENSDDSSTKRPAAHIINPRNRFSKQPAFHQSYDPRGLKPGKTTTISNFGYFFMWLHNLGQF